MRRVLALCIGTIAVAAAFAPPALAGRIVVDNDFADCPDADTNSIEVGVEMANPGDTVFVCRGIYSEMVTMEPDDSDIRVRGQDVDDVVLDGQDALAAGFHLGGVTDVVVERFTVRRYHDDIVLNGANDNRIRRNVTTLAFGHDGITLQNSHGNRIERNISFFNQNSIACGISVGAGSTNNLVRHNLTFNNSNVGILIGFPAALGGPAGPGNVVVHNVSRDNGKPVPAATGGTGIFNNNTPGTVIAHNDVRDNNANGILLGAGSTNVLVDHNEVVHNGSNPALHDGIQLSSASGNVVKHNDSRLNIHNGIHLLNSANNLVEHNDLVQNGTPGVANGCGIDITGATSTGNVVRHNESSLHSQAGYRIRGGASGNTLSRNEAEDNPGHGIRLLDGDNNTVERNESEDNGIDGIRADSASTGNTIRRNEMEDNAEHDCHDDSVGPGTAGTANFWIDNEGETENRPGLCRDDDDD
jgi:parallel beta-helix repeat protein